MLCEKVISEFNLGALVKWLWEESHFLKVRGSNPSTVYCMHGYFSL